MNIVVIHQSRSGNTKKAAELLGGAVTSPENKVTVRSTENLDFKELANADDPEALKKQLVDEFTERFANPYVAASHGTVDTVIDPAETRPMIIKALEMLVNKRDKQLPRKHGNINL